MHSYFLLRHITSHRPLVLHLPPPPKKKKERKRKSPKDLIRTIKRKGRVKKDESQKGPEVGGLEALF
jgi:hypothetical protein